MVMVAVAGCLQGEPGTTSTTHGPENLGQPLDIHVQNPTQRDAVLRFSLEGQDDFTFLMPARPVRPNVGAAYDGSVPPGSTLVVRDVELGVEHALTLPSGSEQVFVHIEVEDGNIAPEWSPGAYGYD